MRLLSFRLFLASAIACMMVSCVTKEEQRIEGQWIGVSAPVEFHSINVICTVELQLEKGDVDLSTLKGISMNNSSSALTVNMQTTDGTDLMSCVFKGKWSVIDGDIEFYNFKDSTEISFNKDAEKKYGVSLHGIARELEAQNVEGGIEWSRVLPIVTRSSNRLVVDFMGQEVSLHRIIEDVATDKPVSIEKSFSGKVAGQSVTMILDFEGEKVNGKCLYTSVGSDQWLSLSGKVSDGKVFLYETNQDGVATASYEFDYCNKYSPYQLKGTVTNGMGKTFTAELSEE